MWGRSSNHQLYFVGGLPLPHSKYNMADGSHLEISLWRHNLAADGPIRMKFGTATQNHTSTTMKTESKIPVS